MKAVVYEKYGSPEVLRLKEVPKPIPGDNEVLVKVHAASVNNWDWDRLTGKPFLYRLISGLIKPKLGILGCDVAGTVEQVGSNVTKFKPGDEVFGDLSEEKWGAFAEYACATENALLAKPALLPFEEAAAIPQAGAMAVQGLQKIADRHTIQRILLNGAAGAVGSFAIQIAKQWGHEVTAVDHGEKLQFMSELGADFTIDYTRENFTQNGKKYDLIMDVVANQSASAYKKSLTEKGKFVAIGGKIPTILNIAFTGPMHSRKNGRQIGILGIKANKNLDIILEMVASKKIKPIIDKMYPLEETADALQYIGEGKVMGKLVIKMR